MVDELEGLTGAVEAIGEASELAMACHVGPDGDALGSMLALAMAARAAGKQVHPSFGEPFVIPETYRFLPTDVLVRPSEVPEAPEVMVTFDAGSADRLGELETNAKAAGTLIVIDHHASNTGFGDINLILPQAAATAEVVIRLLDALGWELNATIATCLHTALVTDTGRFQYSNTSPETLALAARLVAAGARPEVIGQHVYEESPFGYLKVAGRVLERAVLEPERRLVWSVLTSADLEEGGIGLDDTDPLIDTLRVAKESDVAVLLKQLEERRVKVSMRSRGRVDVGMIAVELGGGGHHNAAGATVEATPEEVMAEIRRRLAVVAAQDSGDEVGS